MKIYAIQMIFSDDDDRSAQSFGADVIGALEAGGLKASRVFVREIRDGDEYREAVLAMGGNPAGAS